MSYLRSGRRCRLPRPGAACEITNAEFISLEESDHVGAHLAQVDPVLPAVLHTLRGTG
jgi:hypothetical protein